MNKRTLGTVIAVIGVVAAAIIFGIKVSGVIAISNVVFYGVSISAIALTVIAKLLYRSADKLPTEA